eukprot:scaffold4752_cov17-Tisochrysis_lutea.AAC.1
MEAARSQVRRGPSGGSKSPVLSDQTSDHLRHVLTSQLSGTHDLLLPTPLSFSLFADACCQCSIPWCRVKHAAPIPGNRMPRCFSNGAPPTHACWPPAASHAAHDAPCSSTGGLWLPVDPWFALRVCSLWRGHHQGMLAIVASTDRLFWRSCPRRRQLN